MNHIYKSIFNKALGVFTAVPEFASAHGKGSERTVVGRVAKGTAGFAASALAISVGLALTSTSAVAAPGIFINNGQDPACLAVIDDVATSALQLIYGGSKTIYPAVGVAAGSPLGTKSNFELDARNPCLPTGGTDAENHNTQTNRTLFYNSKNLTLGGRLDVNSGIIGVGDRGTNGTGATNSIRMGTGTTLDDTNKHTNAIAIGVDTATTAEGAVAISAEAKARTSYSIAIGRNATAGGDMVPPSNETGGAIAIGRNSLSNYIGAIALGNGAQVSSAKPDGKTTDGIAIGTQALVDNYRGMAIGAQSQAKGSQSIVLANNAPNAKVSVASGIRSQVYGVESEASGTDAVAIGYKNTVAAHRTYAIGNEINVAKEAEEALAFGTRAHVSGAYQISLGSDAGADAVAPNTSGIAIGRNAGRYGQSGILNTAIGAASGQYVSGSYNIAMGTGAGSGTDAEKLAASQTISIGHNAKASKHTAIAMGTTAQARTEKSVALGENAIAGDTAAPTVKKGEYSTAIGSSTSALGYGATAVGSITKAKVNYATALGHEAEASGLGETSLGYGAGANSTSPNGNRNGVNVGTNAGRYAISGGNNVAVGISAGQYVEGDNNIAQGYSAGYYIKGNENVSIGTNANVGSATDKLEVSKTVAIGSAAKTSASNAIALGNTATATKENSIAQGTESATYGKNSVSIGYKAVSGLTAPTASQTNAFSVSIGNETEAIDASTIAIGDKAKAKGGVDALAVGTQANAMTYKALAIGAYSQATGRQSTVIGNDIQGQPSIASGTRSQILGVQSNVSGDNSVSIGDTNTVASARTYALGNNINAAAGTDDSLAFGTRAHVSGANQVSIGTDAGADNTSAGEGNTAGISIGNDAGRYATAGKNNTSIGQRAGQYANGDNNVAIGKDAGSLDAAGAPLTTNTVSIGSSSKVKGQEAIAVGNEAEAISNSAIAIGNSAKGRALYSTAIGLRAKTSDDATMTFGESATAVGHAAAATRYSAAAFGHDSFADGESSVALGYAAKALGTEQIAIGAHAGQNRQGTQTGANFSVAIGRSAGGDAASALGNHSGVSVGLDAGRYLQDGSRNTAVGGYAGQYVKGSYNVALGHGAGSGTATEHLEASETISIGHNSKASAAYSTAIGTNANAAQANSVALGAGSTTSDVHTGDYTLNGSYTAAGLPKVANGTVSVGAVGKERQIQNVAAGVISATSTDAINGSQLYATNNYLSNLAGGVKNVLGGDAAVDNAGNVTMSNIGGTGKGNVNDAIAAANTKVAAGENITVTPTDNADGSKTYTVATKKDLVVNSVKAGDTTVNTDGVTIAGGPSITKSGINANGRKVTGLVDGDINATSTDAVNGSQLHATNTKLADVENTANTAVQEIESANPDVLSVKKDGTKVTLTPNVIAGDLVNPATGKVNTPAAGDAGKLVTAGTVAKALAETHFVVDTKATTGGELDGASQADQKIKSGNKVTLQAGKNLKAKQTNGTDGAQVEFSLKDSISLTQVTAGDSTLNTDGLTIAGGPSVKKDGINAGNKKITGVANGNVAAGSTDAVNGGQLAEVKSKADSAVQNVVSTNPTALTATKAGDTVTLTPNFIAGDLVNADGTVNDPAAADEGKLVSAKAVADALKANHFVVDTKANGGKTEAGSEENAKVGSSNKVTFEAGKNLAAKQANTANGGATVKFSLQDDISLNSVTAGTGDNQVVLGNDGVKVGGKTYINNDGLNANDKKITNVAPGAVTPTSKDAVNGGQLYDVAKNVADLVGPDAKIDPATGKVSVADPAQGIGGTGKDNIGDAIKAVNATAAKHTTVVEGKNVKVTKGKNAAGGDEYTVATKDDLDVTSVTAGNTTVNTNGLTITGGPSVTRGGIDAGNRIISGVKAGDVSATSQEAVNGSQLHATNTKLDGVKAKADTAVQDVKSGDENALTAVKDPNTNIVTVTPKLSGNLVDADGNITAPATPADKGKLVTAGTVAQALANTHFVVDTKATDGELDGASQADQKIKAGNKVTLQAGKNLKAKQTNGANGAEVEFSLKDSISLKEVTAGEGANQVVLGNDGVKVGGNTYINNAGLNANGNKITNVADGVNPDDAVNKGQLDKVDTKVSNVAQNVVNVLGGDATVNGNGDITMTNIGETGKGNINDAIKSVNDLAKKAAAEKTSVKAKEGRSNVTVTEGVNAAGGHEYTVDVERSVTNAGSNYVTVTNNHDADTNTTTYTVDVSAKTKASLAKADSAVQGLTSKDGNLNFTKGANGNVEVSFNDNLNVKNVTTDRVQVANGPSMSKDGINAAGKAISNVANGNVAADSKDAVNGGQLHETAKSVADVIGGGATVKDGKVVAGQNGIGNTGQNTVHGAIAAINQNTANNFNQIRGDLRKMDRDLRGGIAGALATAGLPQAFRPGKSMVAAAASTYRGQSGLAIGVSRISDNGKVILKVTGNTNSRGDFGGTIGAGYQW